MKEFNHFETAAVDKCAIYVLFRESTFSLILLILGAKNMNYPPNCKVGSGILLKLTS